jgi:hypothetical protein
MPALPRQLAAFRVLIGFGLKILHVNHALLDHGASAHGSALEGDVAGRQRAVVSDEPEGIPIDAEDDDIEGLTQPGRAPRDAVEDRLHVGGRARDDPQDLAGRGLLLERFGQAVLEPATAVGAWRR